MRNGLAESVDIFPEQLLEEDFQLASSERRWRVLYTKSRHEKAVAKHLTALEIPYFLPLVTKVSISRGRKTKSRIPLFSNYVFMFGDDEERLQAWTTNRLSRVLDVDDTTQLRNDLWQLSQAISSGAPLTKEERLVPGQHVRVRSGQLRGMEGTVIERQGKRRLLVAVNFLQQGASIALDDFQIEAL